MSTPAPSQIVINLGGDLVPANPSLPQPPKNYAAAFDPSSEIYSVNTANANVRQLEDLRSMFSTPPPGGQPQSGEFSMMRMAIISAVLYWLFIKD